MAKTRFLTLLLFFALFSQTPLLAEDLNDLAYENRFLLKAGTILNNEGKGDCLIYPYYDVRTVDGTRQIADIQVENFGEYGIVARLRFRDWARGREVFSADIWIPSKGLWSGTVEINEEGDNARIASDSPVVWQNDTNAFYVSSMLADGPLFSKKKLRKNRSDSPLYGFIEVIGEEKTAPEGPNGTVGRLAKSERDCPNTLRGGLTITRLEDEAFMTYDAVTIGNFSRGQGSLFKSLGSPHPRLDTCEDSLDQLEFQLSKWEIFGPYSVTPFDEGKTSFIVSLPTKHLHYKSGKRINQIDNPFEGPLEISGETLRTRLTEETLGGVADSFIELPYTSNVIGLYREYYGGPTGINNLSLPAYSYESGEIKLISEQTAHALLIQDFEYFQERFSMYRGLPAVGLILREFRNSGQLHTVGTPPEFSAVWGASADETVFIPTVLTGPVSGQTGIDYDYIVGGSYSSVGHPIEYMIDWGDGTTSDWLSESAPADSHAWAFPGVFHVRGRARCAIHPTVISGWSSGIFVTMSMEVISTPTKPVGPTFAVVNKDPDYPFDKEYQFTTGGSTSSLGHAVEYQFDWRGDGTTDLSDWGPFIQTKAWDEGGTFTVRARARCVNHQEIMSDWSAGLVVVVEAVSAPSVLSGPTSGIPNTTYTYSTGGSVSTLGHSVQYFFDWGDGSNTGWLPAGVTSASKAWPVGKESGYKVKSRARCVTNPLAVSDWTPELTVNIEFVTAPTTPVGEIKGLPGVSYTYTTGGAFSSLGDPVEYQFDWNGDGITDLSPWGPETQSKAWPGGGTFSVRARARCVTHPTVLSDWSPPLTVEIEMITVTTPVGPTTVTIGGSPSTYTATATSNIGDPVQIRFFTSDGGDSGWLAAPGGTASFQKAWDTPGIFSVTAKGRCATHSTLESALSPGLTVTVGNAVPTLTSILPLSGNRLQTLDVALNGTNFSGSTLVTFGSDITVNTTMATSPTQITANLTSAGTAATGPRAVSVTNPAPGGGTATLAGGFTVTNPAPTLASILPANGSRLLGTALDVVLTGTNYVSGSSVNFGPDIAGNLTTVDSATQITVNIMISATAALGARDVSVTNSTPGGGTATLTGGFTVDP